MCGRLVLTGWTILYLHWFSSARGGGDQDAYAKATDKSSQVAARSQAVHVLRWLHFMHVILISWLLKT